MPAASLSMVLRRSEVPTRHGVQKPQLSCAKKCVKLRATSNMSRSRENTMKAPAVGRSSKAMMRSNSRKEMQVPDGPETCTAWASSAPHSMRICRTVTPKGTS